MSRVGSEIARLRREKGITQKQLGKMAGVSESFIDEVESGKKVLNGALFARIIKLLGQEEDKYELYTDDKAEPGKEIPVKSMKAVPKPVQAIWDDALAGVLKSIPVYEYAMDKAIESRQLPVISNKVEGYPKDKVFYLKISDDDMSGFRIMKGDIALAFSNPEIEKDAIYLIELQGKRMIRQIKKLGGEKLLLVNNSGNLGTEMTTVKDIKVLARLVKLEIVL